MKLGRAGEAFFLEKKNSVGIHDSTESKHRTTSLDYSSLHMNTDSVTDTIKDIEPPPFRLKNILFLKILLILNFINLILYHLLQTI
jgi:hypothetical protein